MNTVDVVDYIPVLQQTPYALAVYTTLKHFSNKKGQCDICLNDVCTNLDIAADEMKAACQALIALKLIAKLETGFTINMAPKRLVNNSKLADYAFGQVIPNGYEVLIDQKQMYRCFTTNGLALWKVLAEVAHFFNLDYLVVKRLMDNENFKTQFMAARKAAEDAASTTGQKVTKRQLTKKSEKTVSELYEQLMTEIHIKNEHEIPQHEWKAPQLLRWYCMLYQKRYNDAFVFTQNPFGSQEMRQMKKVHEAFDLDATAAVAFLQWVFDVKSNEASIRYPLGPNFVANDNVIREYKQKGSTIQKHIKSPIVKIERKSPLPTSFIEWIVENYPKVQSTFILSTMEDLHWIKKAYDENQLPDPALAPVILKAIELELIPQDGEVQFG